MKALKKNVVLFGLILVALFTMALQLAEGTEKAIVFLVMALLGWFGPKPIARIMSLLHLNGVPAVLVTYVVAGLIGAGALAISGQVLDFAWNMENLLPIATAFYAAAQVSFTRLKDKGAFSS